MMNKKIFLGVCVLSLLLAGCRGYRTEKAPFHVNPNMDWQPKFKGQQLSLTPPENTVVFGNSSLDTDEQKREQYLKSNTAFYFGKTDKGEWVKKVPVKVDKEFVLRGQERFNIYCGACHDRAGTGQGPVVKRGFAPPPHLSDDRIVAYTDGELFNVISNGIRTMPGYRKQITESDRWAIVTYVRALQQSQRASVTDLSADQKKELK